MISREEAREALELMLSAPLDTPEPILRRFAALPGAVSHIKGDKGDFVYVPGKRDDRVVLVAHSDTVWDKAYTGRDCRGGFVCGEGIYSSESERHGIGADDRAGCAILWLLRESGHSLLITDGEEHGQTGVSSIRRGYPDLFAELNAHCYMIQADRRNGTDYKFYDLPVSAEFRRFVTESTGYFDAGRFSRTDIVGLCRTVCGVNLSVGYHDEHTPDEYLDFDEWYNSLCVIERMIAPPQKRYPLI